MLIKDLPVAGAFAGMLGEFIVYYTAYMKTSFDADMSRDLVERCSYSQLVSVTAQFGNIRSPTGFLYHAFVNLLLLRIDTRVVGMITVSLTRALPIGTVCTSLLTLFVLGVVKSKVVSQNPLKGGMYMLLQGALSAAAR